jgi:hypothetical protein
MTDSSVAAKSPQDGFAILAVIINGPHELPWTGQSGGRFSNPEVNRYWLPIFFL